ncbi:MAG: hypothetical protein KGI75_20005 [Rhizobiaceae bacterium]|nr:hypothetical protein [Rhizobiaceae bacterium]
MAIERKSPLPRARYWITGFGENELTLATYLKTQSMAGFVDVTITENIDETSDHPRGSFFVFVVKEPNAVPWPATLFGFPNLAGADIKSLADTVQRPDKPQDGFDNLGDLIEKVADTGSTIAWLAGGAALVLILLNLRRK